MRAFAHQQFQQFHVGRVELQRHAFAGDLKGVQIELQVGNHHHPVVLALPPADYRVYPGEHFGHCKRLGDVVVGPYLETGEPIIQFIARTEHHNRDV